MLVAAEADATAANSRLERERAETAQARAETAASTDRLEQERAETAAARCVNGRVTQVAERPVKEVPKNPFAVPAAEPKPSLQELAEQAEADAEAATARNEAATEIANNAELLADTFLANEKKD